MLRVDIMFACHRLGIWAHALLDFAALALIHSIYFFNKIHYHRLIFPRHCIWTVAGAAVIVAWPFARLQRCQYTREVPQASSVVVAPWWWSGLILASIIAYVVLDAIRVQYGWVPWGAMDCAWQLLMSSSLAGAAHLAVGGRLRNEWLPSGCFAVLLLLQPLLMVDRIPLSVQAVGCPSGIQTSYALAALLLAVWLTLREDALCVSTVRQQSFEQGLRTTSPASHARPPRPSVLLVFDWVPMGCGLLSCAYLMLAFQLAHPAARVAYHLTWSLLRPAYLALFSGYALKRRPGPCPVAWLQTFVTTLGVTFFSCFCALARTGKTQPFGSASTCDDVSSGEGGLLPHDLAHALTHTPPPPPATPYKQLIMGQAAHAVEGACFYSSMGLFFWHGLYDAKWGPITARFAALGAVAYAMMVLAAIDSDYLDGELIHGMDHAWKHSEGVIARFYFAGAGWQFFHYSAGYLSIVFIATCTLIDSCSRSPTLSLTTLTLTRLPPKKLLI